MILSLLFMVVVFVYSVEPGAIGFSFGLNLGLRGPHHHKPSRFLRPSLRGFGPVGPHPPHRFHGDLNEGPDHGLLIDENRRFHHGDSSQNNQGDRFNEGARGYADEYGNSERTGESFGSSHRYGSNRGYRPVHSDSQGTNRGINFGPGNNDEYRPISRGERRQKGNQRFGSNIVQGFGEDAPIINYGHGHNRGRDEESGEGGQRGYGQHFGKEEGAISEQGSHRNNRPRDNEDLGQEIGGRFIPDSQIGKGKTPVYTSVIENDETLSTDRSKPKAFAAGDVALAPGVIRRTDGRNHGTRVDKSEGIPFDQGGYGGLEDFGDQNKPKGGLTEESVYDGTASGAISARRKSKA